MTSLDPAPTLEERLERLEIGHRNHETSINLLVSIAERQQTILEEIQGLLSEMKADTAMNRRLWVHLAQKNGWMDDDDWPPANPPEL